jgi:hypothetical protein
MPQRRFSWVAKTLAAVMPTVVPVMLALIVASRAQAGEPRYFAITNARIVPVSGPIIDSGTVVISKGLIAAVGKDAAIPPEAWVIDGKGLTVYPGLFDALTDLGLTAGAAPAGGGHAGGGPGGGPPPARGPEDRPNSTPWIVAADELKADDKRIETWRNGGFTTALTAPKTGLLPGQGTVIDLAGERPGDLVVKQSASLQVSLTPTGGFFGFPGSLIGVIGYLKQVFFDAQRDAEAQRIYDASPRGHGRPPYDRTIRAIEEATRAGRPVLLPAVTVPQILRAFDIAEKIGVKPVVLYGGTQAYRVADQIAAHKFQVLVNLKWPEKEKDADPEAEESLRTLRVRDRAPGTPAALEKAGVKFAFYSDGLTTTKDIMKNAKKAIDAGLKPDAALRALTLSPAEIFGVADRLGTIEPGKIANLVVADGDLFEEKTKVKFVFVDGRKFEIREEERPKEPPKGDISGKWKINFTTPEGAQEATADLTMAADGTISGTVTHPHGTSTISSGWLSADKFRITFSVSMGEPGPTEVTFSGTLEGNTLKGNVSAGDFSTDFTATRPGLQSAGEANWEASDETE